MVWVKSEYAGEFAVVSAWVAALLPWYVGYAPVAGGFGPRIRIRFPFLQFQYYMGVPHNEEFRQLVFTSPWRASEADFSGVGVAYDLWFVGAAVVALAVLLSLAMYRDLEAVRAVLPVHPVRAMGALLVLASVPMALATVQFVRLAKTTEYPLPVGLAVLALLGGLLLRADLVGDATADADTATDSDAADASDAS